MRNCGIFFYLFILLICFYRNIDVEAAEQKTGSTKSHSYTKHLAETLHTPRELIVRLHPNSTSHQLNTFSEKFGIESISPVFSPNTPAGRHPSLSRIYLIRFPNNVQLNEVMDKYAENGLIETVEMNRLNRFYAETIPTDPQYDKQWNLKAINLPKAWSIEQGKPSVIVAVVDSGIEREHPEFRNQFWNNSNEIPANGVDDDENGYVDDINGWDFTDAPTLPGHGDWKERDNQPDDETGHGTHVSGIIAAEANNKIGIAGIAWKCRLMPLRTGFRVGAGSFFQNDDIAAAIVYAADNGADVINLSLGDTVNAFVMSDAIEYAYNRGCIIVAAAGNSSEPGSYYPAALDTVVSVAALDQELQLGGSNFGASIDIAAPGEDIRSTYLLDPSLSEPGYINLSGTSMAAAHVSGVAALLISANPSCSNRQIQQWLTDTARQLSITNLIGAGLIDAYASLTQHTELIAQISVSPTKPTQLSDKPKIIEVFGSAGGAKFTQYWLDYGLTETPDLWFPIGFPQTKPKYNSVLYEWDTSALNAGIYTLRLSVKGEDGQPIRDKIVVEIQHTLPQISKHEGSVWLSENRYDSTIIWQTDVLTTGTVEIYPITQTDTNILNNTPLRIAISDSVHQQHIVYLSDSGLPNGEYAYRLKSQNRSGFIRIDDNNNQLYTITVHEAQIPPSHLQPIGTAQLDLHAIVVQTDINGNGKLELAGIETAMSGELSAHFYEIDNNRNPIRIAPLAPSISVYRIWASADTDGDGLVELLCNGSEDTFLIEQSTPQDFPNREIWRTHGIWGGIIQDMDLDGKPEIYSRHDTTNSIWVHESDGNNSYSNVAILNNPTQGKNDLENRFATGDFDADGQIEILAGDSDGELFIYENVGNNEYKQTWITTLPDGIPHLFAAGDLDGDTIPEFVVGSKVWTTEFDLPRQHWLFTIFTSNGNDSYITVWHQRIRQYRDEDSGITIADANNDGRNELCIATTPNFYLVQYDGTTYRPVWHHNASATFNPIVADLENDGLQELLFNTDNALTVFQNTHTLGNPKRLIPPWGIIAKPIDETSISLQWQSEPTTIAFTIYRGQTQKSIKPIRKDVRQKHFTDAGLTTGQTYWYAIASQSSNGEVSNYPPPVSVMPTDPPKLISAVHSPPHQLLLTFNKPMDVTAANPSRYRLHPKINRDGTDAEVTGTEVISPQSAIFDRSRKRIVLSFPYNVFKTDRKYDIETLQLSDIYGAEIPQDKRTISVEFPVLSPTDAVVYPNPARDNQVTFDRISPSTHIYIYDVAGNRIASLVPTEDDILGNRCKKVWYLDGVSSGIYIYVLETDSGRQVGKLSVVK